MDTQERTRRIIERWRPVLRALSGVDDVVEKICPDCSFEDRNGHGPLCPGRRLDGKRCSEGL